MLSKTIQLIIGIMVVIGFGVQDIHAKTTTNTDTVVYVTFWFDTEDFILPETDDAVMRIAEMFSERGVQATYKIVGEKARVLQERGRDDVILELSKHDISYHSTYHSIHPTPAEYSRDLNWHDGVSEFMRREGVGLQWLKEVFGVNPSCYGQPGNSWTPQSYAALRQWGIPLYLDATNQVNLDNRPFWYGGLLNVLELGDAIVRTNGWNEESLKKTCAQFDKVHQRLMQEGGGIISIYYHPCELIHEEFWDGVNFSKGANPTREDWKMTPMKSKEECEQAFDIFEKYLDYVAKHSAVQLVTAREIPVLYIDKAYTRDLDKNDLMKIAAKLSKDINYIPLDKSRMASAGEGFYALTSVLAKSEDSGQYPESIKVKFVYGPADRAQQFTKHQSVTWKALISAAKDALQIMDQTQQMPATVWVAGKPWHPENFVATIAKGLLSELKNQGDIQTIDLQKPAFSALNYVADDSPELWGGWPIHPEGFHAPGLMDLAKLQGWTLKPAIRR
jgi:hypothetical protein